MCAQLLITSSENSTVWDASKMKSRRWKVEEGEDGDDGPNVTKNVDNFGIEEVAGNNNPQSQTPDVECQLKSLLAKMTETLADSVTDRFHSALHEPSFQVCSYFDPQFKAMYERSSIVIDEVKKEMRKKLTSQENGVEAQSIAGLTTSHARTVDFIHIKCQWSTSWSSARPRANPAAVSISGVAFVLVQRQGGPRHSRSNKS